VLHRYEPRPRHSTRDNGRHRVGREIAPGTHPAIGGTCTWPDIADHESAQEDVSDAPEISVAMVGSDAIGFRGRRTPAEATRGSSKSEPLQEQIGACLRHQLPRPGPDRHRPVGLPAVVGDPGRLRQCHSRVHNYAEICQRLSSMLE